MIKMNSIYKTSLTLITLLNPILGGTLLDKANLLYNSGKLHESIKVYKQAAQAGDNPALCYVNAANAYYQLDSLPQAAVLYKSCIMLAPLYAKAYLNLAVVYYTLNDMAECISSARRFCELEKDNQKGRLILAYAYRSVGDLSNAVITFEDLIQDYPQMEESYIALAEIYKELGDLDESIRWLSSYPQSGKNIERVYSMLAELNEQKGDLAKTLFNLQQVFSINNSNRWCLYKIVSIQEKMGNDLVAYETALDGMSRFPDFSDIAVLAGNLAFNRHRLEDAERCYTAANKLGNASALVGLENVTAQRMKDIGSN